ncbi:hypothetical protein CLV96_3930 [Leptospira meyeri]|uniref:Uncharacterized protein n=1 Tax=Leptospira meyeri TaxID=29508 RepID=A0A4R8MIV8_LEPME|nr:hypothetical protein LEP1GSC017_0014 [Leptospira meyeri serovar Hardjo str. Went 5]TDY66551.1 hypothetical protein CLV96_3930 [Leptospira meyeri]
MQQSRAIRFFEIETNVNNPDYIRFLGIDYLNRYLNIHTR